MSDVLLAVAGAHLRGQPLHHQLADRNAVFVCAAMTSADYRMFALATTPSKPGVVRVAAGGAALDVEVWGLSFASFGSFVAALPQPMGIGQISMADGSLVSGFIVESIAIVGAEDITRFGGWRAFLESR